MPKRSILLTIIAIIALSIVFSALRAGEPPALNPFGQAPSEREDAVPGYIELSNGAIRAGMIYLTRDKRLQIYDKQLERQREIPLQKVKKIECTVKREWLEKEWKFKETTNDEKLYTGRSYPAREYLHTITLKDGRTITGPLAAIVYVQPPTTVPARARTLSLEQAQQRRDGGNSEIPGLRKADQVGQGGDGRSDKEGAGTTCRERSGTMNDELKMPRRGVKPHAVLQP